MLAIKLKRIGKKHQAAFRIVVAEKRSKLGGCNVEDLGYWNPYNKNFDVKKERVEHWMKNGAQPTPSVYNLLVKSGAVKGPKIPVHKISNKPAESLPAGKAGAKEEIATETAKIPQETIAQQETETTA